MCVQCFAAMSAKSSLEKWEYKRDGLGAHDVEVEISHCGICHSDIHLIDDDWGMSGYPLVPGHEIIGKVRKVGPGVTNLEIGQRVGVGWQRGSCGKCEFCISGQENLCSEHKATCVDGYGGFAESVAVSERFVFPIPEALDSENAAPLLCAGITVYSPLRVFDVKPFMRVGVIGVGGLGHVALQFANKFGCEVTAFSSTSDKKAEAMKFGAHHFVASNDGTAISSAAGSLDFIMSTVPADLDWSMYVNTLRAGGKLCFLGVPPSPLTIHPIHLLMGQKSICASPIGGRTLMLEMLSFSARHKIVAQTELLPMSEVNTAIEKVRRNKARYRMVLKA